MQVSSIGLPYKQPCLSASGSLPIQIYRHCYDKQLNPELGWVMTLLFNMLSRCLVISIPSGTRRDNSPTGIQLVGLGYEVTRVIQAAFAYEAVFEPWHVHPDNRRLLENEE